MSEAQRFLRYVTPGLVFLAETLLLLLILLPDWTVTQIKAVKGDEALGVVFATLLASGGVGFLFSVLHHVIHWTFGAPAVDHSGLIARLRATKVIQLLDARTGLPVADAATVTRAEAWAIATSLWNERVTVSEHVKGAEPKAAGLGDMVHTTGTARAASLVAWITALAIAAHVADFSSETGPMLRFLLANLVGLFLVWLHHTNCIRMGTLAQGLIEEVLHDALVTEKEKPIRTHVILTRPEAGPAALGVIPEPPNNEMQRTRPAQATQPRR